MHTKINLKIFNIFCFLFLFVIVFAGLYYQYLAFNEMTIKNFENSNYNTSLEIREKFRLIFDKIQYEFIQKEQENIKKLEELDAFYTLHKEDFNATAIAEVLNKDVAFGKYGVFLINKNSIIEKTSYAKDIGLNFSPYKGMIDLFDNVFAKNIMMDISSPKVDMCSMNLKKYLIKLSADGKYIIQLGYFLDYKERLNTQLQYFSTNNTSINLYLATEFSIQQLDLTSDSMKKKTLAYDWEHTRKILADINQGLKSQKIEMLLTADISKENIKLNQELTKLIPINNKLISYVDTNANKINFFSTTDSIFGDHSNTILFIKTSFSLESLKAHLKSNLHTFITIFGVIVLILLVIGYFIEKEVVSKIIFITEKIKHHEIINNGHARIEDICILTDNYNLMLNALNRQIYINKEMAYIDALSELKNRKAYDEILLEFIALYQRYNTIFSIAILDIDDFKKINDTYGHSMGDIVIKELSKLLKISIRNSDIPFRIGGEEFVIIFPNTLQNESKKILEAILEKVENSTIVNENTTITLSAGLTEIKSGDTADSLFERIDTFLYHTKTNGKNKVTSY